MPAVITADQLQYTYSWSAIPPDDPKVTGIADTTFLNRHEGYEVLPFLNRICTTYAGAIKAEAMIRNHLPGDVRSRKNVFVWLKANWKRFT